MELSHRWNDRNLTRLELVTSVLILGLLIGLFSRYMLSVFAQAERSMMNSTILAFNTALNYRGTIAVMTQQYDELEYLLMMNPMEDMRTTPEINNYSSKLAGNTISPPLNYGGVITSKNLDFMEKGKWYYQQDEHLILYTPSNTDFLKSEIKDLESIRFRINIDYKDINANGKYEPEIDEFNAVKIQALDKYVWEI